MVRSEKKRLRNAAREEPQPTDSFEVKYIILHSPKTKIKWLTKTNGNIYGNNFVTG